VPVRGRRLLRPGNLGSEADRATFRTLHTASMMSSALRSGLSQTSAETSVRHLRALVGTPGVALTDAAGTVLAWEGRCHGHLAHATELAARAVSSGKYVGRGLDCPDPACGIRQAVVSPLTADERVVGTLQVFSGSASAGLVRATSELAGWVSGQLDLGELAHSRAALAEAEVRALRAQISPHFVYNALTAIASFVRTDPDRARDLLMEFADFTRYTFQKHGEFTTLGEELRSIERYLVLEQARFGDRLAVTLRIAPEVLPVPVPVLSVQPLVENAVRHGLAGKPGPGRVTILAEDAGNDAVIAVEDDGVGEDPDRIRRALSGDVEDDAVGLANVDGRLRSVYGDDYGLVVETAPGAGTKVTVRIPKFATGTHR
jgi:two-component system, LytTR family, sensor kinase